MYYFRRILFSIFLFASLSFVAAQRLEESAAMELGERIERAMQQKMGREVLLPLCEQMLARDVISDLILNGETPIRNTMSALQSIQELGPYVEQWKEDVAEAPTSDRLNFLLGMAALEYAPSPTRIGSSDYFPPLRVKITREGDEICLKSPAFFGQDDCAAIRMSRTAMIGFFANGVSGRFKEIALISKGETVIDPSWKQAQLGARGGDGSIKVTGDSLEIHGAGAAPFAAMAETCFFAYHELEGDGSLEVLIDGIAADKSNGMIGVMIRESLDPSAPQSSIVFARNNNSVYFVRRAVQHEAPGYFIALCESRPNDVDFLVACLHLLMRERISMGHIAVGIAERLIEKHRGIAVRERYLLQEIFQKQGQSKRFAELLSRETSNDAGIPKEEALRLFYLWLESGIGLLEQGNAEEALALWDRAEALSLQMPLPVQIRLKRSLVYGYLERHSEAKEDLRRLFLGEEGQDSTEPFMQEVRLSQPALAPVISLALHLAVREGIAVDIAQALEKKSDSGSGRVNAEAMALGLRIAARDSAAIARLNRGGAISDLVRRFTPQGLYLILFELQQFAEGRPIAFKLLKALLATGNPAFADDREALWLWQLRLAEFQGVPKLIDEAALDLTRYAQEADVSALAFSKAMEILLKRGDLKSAGALLTHRQEKHRRLSKDNIFNQEGEAIHLLKLHSGEGNPMPFVSAHTDGENMKVCWWLGSNIYPGMLLPEARYFEAPMPVFDQRFTLELYGVGGGVYHTQISDEDRLHTFDAAANRGEWSGPFLKDRHWIAATIRDASGEVVASPAVPVTAGTNFLGPLDPKLLKEKSGQWKAVRNSFWAVTLRNGGLKESVFLSRLRPGMGFMEFCHERIPIDPNRNYVFTAWMKVDSVQREEDSYYAGASRMGVVFLNAQNESVGEWYEYPSIGNRWTLLAKRFGALHRAGVQAIPPDAVFAEVRIRFEAQCEVAEIGFFSAPEAR